MDDQDEIARLFGASHYPGQRRPGHGPVPRRGENPDFDELCDQVLEGDMDQTPELVQEMRRALWATWRTDAPRGREMPERPSTDEEDAELALALAESARESRNGSRAQSLVPGDEDEELMRAIRMSEEEARAPKRVRRDSTPEEERRMLAEAMAASLAEQPNVEVLQDPSDDEDLTRANEEFRASRETFREEEMRRREAKRNSATNTAETTPAPGGEAPSGGERVSGSTGTAAEAVKPTQGDPAPKTGLAAALGDRAQMERDRLARQAARQANQSGHARPSNTSSTGALPESSTPITAHSDRPKVATLGDISASDASSSRRTINGRTANAASASGTSSSSTTYANPYHPFRTASPRQDAAGEYYLDGELRHTAMTIGRPSNEPTFTAEQVIGNKDQISLIIMSSFVVDDEWLQGLLPPAHLVPRIIIRPHSKEHPEFNGKIHILKDGELRCYPMMTDNWGSAHMKFFWIVYRTGRLRAAVMTANMVPYDWDWIENTVFVQDFLQHRRRATETLSPPTDDFPLQFRNILTHLKLYKALYYILAEHPFGKDVPLTPSGQFASLSKWDWSRVRVKVVMSVPGRYAGAEEMDKLGMIRLGKVLSVSGWKPKPGEEVKVEYQGSSLGTYSIDWMDAFYKICCGVPPSLIPKPTGLPPIKIVFPSLATVEASEVGREGGGTMFCGKNAYNGATKHLFHDANSKLGGVLMHSKVIIALFEPRPDALGVMKQSSKEKAASGSGKRKADEMEMEGEDEGVGGWVYVGSHNFTGAAWGTVNLKATPPTLFMRNYELGIVFPLPRENAGKVADAVAPHKRPIRPYSATDIPWDQAKHLNAAG